MSKNALLILAPHPVTADARLRAAANAAHAPHKGPNKDPHPDPNKSPPENPSQHPAQLQPVCAPDTCTHDALTRVWLTDQAPRLTIELRFGHPLHVHQLRPGWRMAVFGAGDVFCRVLREQASGAWTRWQVMVMQAQSGHTHVQRVTGVDPGASLLVRADGVMATSQVLRHIDAVAATGIDPAAVSPAYWRTLNNRLHARQPLPEFTPERHQAWLAKKALP